MGIAISGTDVLIARTPRTLRRMLLRNALLITALTSTLYGCRHDAGEKTGEKTGEKAGANAASEAAAKQGRKATEQWQDHEQEEERNRQRCFDFERRPQHRTVLAALERLRKGYDRAKSKTEIAAAQARATREAPALREQIDQIDPWQNSSLLVADDAALLDLLTQPSAGAQSGDAAELKALRGELRQRLQSLQQKLKESEKCERD
jgi:hypothetical protein